MAQYGRNESNEVILHFGEVFGLICGILRYQKKGPLG